MNLLAKLKLLTRKDIAKFCNGKVFYRALDYVEDNLISGVKLNKNMAIAVVRGNRARRYTVKIRYDPLRDILNTSCTCPAKKVSPCKHTIAFLLWLGRGKGISTKPVLLSKIAPTITSEKLNLDELIKIGNDPNGCRLTRGKIASIISKRFPEDAKKIYAELVSLYVQDCKKASYEKAVYLLKDLRDVYFKLEQADLWSKYIGELMTKQRGKRTFIRKISDKLQF